MRVIRSLLWRLVKESTVRNSCCTETHMQGQKFLFHYFVAVPVPYTGQWEAATPSIYLCRLFHVHGLPCPTWNGLLGLLTHGTWMREEDSRSESFSFPSLATRGAHRTSRSEAFPLIPDQTVIGIHGIFLIFHWLPAKCDPPSVFAGKEGWILCRRTYVH